MSMFDFLKGPKGVGDEAQDFKAPKTGESSGAQMRGITPESEEDWENRMGFKSRRVGGGQNYRREKPKPIEKMPSSNINYRFVGLLGEAARISQFNGCGIYIDKNNNTIRSNNFEIIMDSSRPRPTKEVILGDVGSRSPRDLRICAIGEDQKSQIVDYLVISREGEIKQESSESFLFDKAESKKRGAIIEISSETQKLLKTKCGEEVIVSGNTLFAPIIGEIDLVGTRPTVMVKVELDYIEGKPIGFRIAAYSESKSGGDKSRCIDVLYAEFGRDDFGQEKFEF